MGPSARLSAVQELMTPLCKGPDFLPIDQSLSNYFRNRRFIGSKDRRFIRETLYIVLHCLQALRFALEAGQQKTDARMMLLVFLKINNALGDDLFTEGKYGLPPLTPDEVKFLNGFKASQEAPPWVAGNCPAWLYEKFEERFGKSAGKELAALNERAPVDIRINLIKTTKELLQDGLKDLGFSPVRFSPVGFRSEKQVPLDQSPLYLKGLIEFQDEGSQLAALILGAKPGDEIVDLCAGAGGKTLALAAAADNKAKIYAFDIVPQKISTLMTRIKRAGVKNCQAAHIPENGPGRDEEIVPMMGQMDKVLLDVPCSGTGVWRRSPDARLRLTKEKLVGYKKSQANLLEEGAALLKPGGKLTYVTCSLLKEENEDQIEAFLGNHPDWKLTDYKENLAGKIPESGSTMPGALLLTPNQHGTDGFFVAKLQKP